MLAHLGHSDDPDSLDAVNEVIDQIMTDLAGAEPKAALLFCSVEYEHQVLLDRIQEQWPGLPLVGGTSDGEFSSSLGFCEDSVLMTVFSGDDLVVHAGMGRDLSGDMDAAVKAAMEGAGMEGAQDFTPSVCLTAFAPTTDASAVISKLAKHLPDVRCPVLGGLSADHREFQRTREFFGNEVLSDSLPILLIQGKIASSWGVGSGWFPIGGEMTITSSEGSVVKEIDGRPALAVYRDNYGEVPSNSLGEYPLAFIDDSGTWVLRATLSMDHDNETLTFAGAIPVGSTVRFTQVLEEGLLSGSEESLTRALSAFEGESPSIALFFSCAARKWVLGSEAEKEIDLLKSVALDRGLTEIILAGLYCFGEIAPSHGGTKNSFHNETCVSIVLG
ncbi:FIST signal transduction protein [Saltatorellus ferox]